MRSETSSETARKVECNDELDLEAALEQLVHKESLDLLEPLASLRAMALFN